MKNKIQELMKKYNISDCDLRSTFDFVESCIGAVRKKEA